MAFPVVESTSTNDFTGDATAHLVTMPSGIVSGNLLIVIFVNDDVATVTQAAWNKFKDMSPNSEARITAWWRKADETEGADEDFVTSSSQRGGSSAYRISGAIDPDTQPPEASTGVSANTTTPDPDIVTPTGGAKEYLFIAACGADSDKADGGPANMSNPLFFGEFAAGGAGGGTAEQTENTETFNPDTFNLTSADWAAAFTIAVHPAIATGSAFEGKNPSFKPRLWFPKPRARIIRR